MTDTKRWLRRVRAVFFLVAGFAFLLLPRALVAGVFPKAQRGRSAFGLDRVFYDVPVGLSAEGVSISYALHNAFHLDVRDALGRPVSAPLIRKEIKTSQAAARAHAALSSLTQARRISFFLECIWKISVFSWGLSTFKTLARVWALPAPKKRDLSVVLRPWPWNIIAVGFLLGSCCLSFIKEVSHRNFSALLC